MTRSYGCVGYHHYTLVTPAGATPVSLAEVKEHLRLDADDDSQDTYLGTLIATATSFGEKYTKRDFITKTFKTYRDRFDSRGFELRRAPLGAVGSVKYYNSEAVLTTVSSDVYYTTASDAYSWLLRVADQSWPTDLQQRRQVIEITFTSGYGAAGSDVPDDIRMALLNHIAALYESRGDCGDCSAVLPGHARALYNSVRILDMWMHGT